MEPPFDKLAGVQSTTSGYIGGRTKDPTYKQVSSGRTGHAEALQVKFDPQVVSYQQLLTVFWHNIDPTQGGGQFCDQGNQYRSAIFYHSEEQKAQANASRQQVKQELGKPIKTLIVKAKVFYPAEEYHQDYYTKNPTKYKFYRWNCGRDKQLDKVWGDKARKP
jgi:peptide-methionine (S)-S-oxide reductase